MKGQEYTQHYKLKNRKNHIDIGIGTILFSLILNNDIFNDTFEYVINDNFCDNRDTC